MRRRCTRASGKRCGGPRSKACGLASHRGECTGKCARLRRLAGVGTDALIISVNGAYVFGAGDKLLSLCKFSFFGDMTELRRLESVVEHRVAGRATWYVTDKDCLDVMPFGVTKGAGLMRLLGGRVDRLHIVSLTGFASAILGAILPELLRHYGGTYRQRSFNEMSRPSCSNRMSLIPTCFGSFSYKL